MFGIVEGAGYFIYPLAVCSLLGVIIIVERLIALRKSAIIPDDLVDAFVSGDVLNQKIDAGTVGGRIVLFYKSNDPDEEGLKAFARLQVNEMERGLFILDIVIAAAPLLGLLGTVTGLVGVFSGFSETTGMPDPAAFVKGIALALSTTVLGLAIAIPALIGNAYLMRRVESLAAKIEVGVERLIDISKKNS
ncbi:MAG: MotA/TolQ/ExbB proton channel family protein [Opitutales bacterium]|nr:MotA/TolQ/ExbB proton channel family protein [Opitutales bacterium]